MNSNDILKNSINKVGVKSIASDMKLSSSLIYKWCQPNDNEDCTGADNPLDRIMKIIELTKDTQAIEWLCQKANGYFVRNPENPSNSTYENIHPVRATQNILSEFSELLSIVSHSIENDQIIDENEASQIRQVWDKLKSVTETFVSSCEKGLYRNS